MAQPAQVFHANAGSGNEYVVIDNGAAPTFVTFNAATHIGYDTIASGANSQGSNAFKNGTIPDFVNAQTSEKIAGTAVPTASAIGFKNPS